MLAHLLALALAAAPGLTVDRVAAGSNSATVTWHAARPVSVIASYGLDGDYGSWTAFSKSATSGTTVLDRLEPGTGYRFELRAGGQAVDGTFTTAPVPAHSTAVITSSGLVVDGQLFFPRMNFRECAWGWPNSIAAGVNLFMGAGCGEAFPDALAGRAYSLVDADARGQDGRGLLGYFQMDEADLYFSRPSELPALPPSTQSHRATFMTFSNHFYSWAAPPTAGRQIYPGLITRAEFLGFDLFPLQTWCKKDLLGTVYDAQRELVNLAAGKPTYQWIEAGQMEFCLGLEPSPAILRAETWLAIAGGARGIGWFPPYWKPDVAKAIGGLSRQITALAPVLLSVDRPVTVLPLNGPIKVGARARNGATVVIAVNSSFKHVNVRITVPGLGTGLVWPMGEGRSLAIRNGVIVDSFRGLGVHIYLVPPAGA